MTGLRPLRSLAGELPEQDDRLPAIFAGHGSPMNGIEDNEFSRGWKHTVKGLPDPRAILCISAHWQTTGTFVTAMARPRTIHDFGGFPRELFEVSYPAPGDPSLAEEVSASVSQTAVGHDHTWGLDHGTWTVVRHMYPDARIPVIQLSLDLSRDAAWHYELGKELAGLRKKGVLVLGSGNIVHNLGMVDWRMMQGGGFDWALESSARFKSLIRAGDHRSLVRYPDLGRAARLAVPTPDHYLPLLYILAIQGKGEEPSFFNDKAVGGSLTMTSVLIQ